MGLLLSFMFLWNMKEKMILLPALAIVLLPVRLFELKPPHEHQNDALDVGARLLLPLRRGALPPPPQVFCRVDDILRSSARRG